MTLTGSFALVCCAKPKNGRRSTSCWLASLKIFKLVGAFVEYVEVPTHREEPWERDRRARQERHGRGRVAPSSEVSTARRPDGSGFVWSRGVLDREARSRLNSQVLRLLVIVLLGSLVVAVVLFAAVSANHVR